MGGTGKCKEKRKRHDKRKKQSQTGFKPTQRGEGGREILKEGKKKGLETPIRAVTLNFAFRKTGGLQML